MYKNTNGWSFSQTKKGLCRGDWTLECGFTWSLAEISQINSRRAHIDRVKAEADDGFWLMGGAMLTHVPTPEDKTIQAAGSAMVAFAASKEEVMQRLKDDVYTSGNVWDWDKVQIWPFRTAIRKGVDGVS